MKITSIFALLLVLLFTVSIVANAYLLSQRLDDREMAENFCQDWQRALHNAGGSLYVGESHKGVYGVNTVVRFGSWVAWGYVTFPNFTATNDWDSIGIVIECRVMPMEETVFELDE